ncbi:adenylyl cyclase X E isoform X2 [Drosophila ananassae]|uniref:adenylyl cyclase X E isoform X2 n=1 Tax=Drosophila ananassae TaxID=7217 RepID=UPI0013A5CAB9|nr:adenylyl cyclase X E isoform X2 [Drosophila ananassae]
MPPKRCLLNYSKERMWEPGYLKAKCKELGLEDEFQLYQIRLWKSYLSVFYLLHILVSISHVTLLLTTCEHVELIYFDVGLFIASAVLLLSILSINFYDTFIANHTWVMFVSSTLAALTLVLTDLFQTFYHKKYTNWTLVSFYDTYIIFMIYMFLPIHFIFGAVCLGLLVSAIYIIYFLIFVRIRFVQLFSDMVRFSGMWVDIVHYMSLNMVGVFFRMMNDIVVRSSFLDRHQYIKEELWLRNARHQEKLLLDSILPPEISEQLQRVIQNRISQAGARSFSVLDRSMTIQVHPDVSILYADVVNYTHLTTTLTVEQLVTILHDLYWRFDMAAARYRVQRIKFLGDCYYCVAGLVEPDPDHADNCVGLGLCMISEIQDVRYIHQLDINMRIGVHSGNLFAGVIGQTKLQYDVWGLDVTIANVLESTGVPGFVHISNVTLSNLDSPEYVVIAGPEKAVNHPLLQKYKIKTYIVESGPSSRESSISNDLNNALSVISINSRPFLHTKNEDESLQAVFNAELHEEFRKMPVSPYNIKEFYNNHRKKGQKNTHTKLYNQVTFFLTFRDLDLEKAYLSRTDFMFKYNILLVWIVGLCLLMIQLADTNGVCAICICLDFFVMLSMFLFTFISWYKKICWWRKGKRNPRYIYDRFSCFLFYIYESIQGSLLIRVFIYLFVTSSNCVVVGIILFNCDRNDFILHKIESKLFHYEDFGTMCFQPWPLTNICAVMISMAITFTRIPFMVRTLVVIAQTLTYILLIFLYYSYNYHNSVSSNPSLSAEYAHCLLILIVAVTSYLKERQIEFANKVNFSWQKELENKERDAHLTNQSIIILLNNILPSHVVEVYLNSLAKHELYYENYQMVSVMFAMLMNFQMDLENLRILNEIITEFDILEYFVVEKIKVVGCTYMAACGLDVSFAGTISNPVNRNSEGLRASIDKSQKDLEEVVFVLTSYALDMMRTLERFKTTYKSLAVLRGQSLGGTISIGISSGEVMAGIVGASQPHYDIWGDAVNMASRMQSTGIADKIQVTEETAIILEEFGVQCNYRGLVYVKGRGEIPTYLVDISKEYDFTVKQSVRKPSYEQRSTILSYFPYEAIDITKELGDRQISFSAMPNQNDHTNI